MKTLWIIPSLESTKRIFLFENKILGFFIFQVIRNADFAFLAFYFGDEDRADLGGIFDMSSAASVGRQIAPSDRALLSFPGFVKRQGFSDIFVDFFLQGLCAWQ